MAECVASAFCLKLNTQRRPVGERGFSGQITNLKTIRRKYSRSGCKFVHFSTWKTFELSVFGATHLKLTPRLQELPIKCIGLGALVDFGGATASDLVPVVDQMLLMGSIFLTYMAGVIPVEKSYSSYQKNKSDKNVFPESSNISGSSAKQNSGFDSKYLLNAVREKLLNSLNALENKDYSGDIILQSAKRPFSLSAVARGPKLRLLWAAFQQVEEENFDKLEQALDQFNKCLKCVFWINMSQLSTFRIEQVFNGLHKINKVNNFSTISKAVDMDDLFGMFFEIIQRSCHSACAVWLEKEFFLLKGNADKELASMVLEKVKGDSTIVQSITRSGKKDLYTELLWYLTFGSLREDCYYDSHIFAVHGISILEDLVVALADGVASVYLEFISVDSDVSSKTNSLDMSLCALSTRELQKLRNEVALNQWLYHNMDTVVSMYEDRFDLCILESQPIDLTDSSQTEEQSWWKRLTQQNSKAMSPELHCIEINHFSMPVKRTKELRALNGWRYYFSLLLELSDITMPLIRTVIDKVSDAISFFLVSLIGRSLGLIYTGIRQSLKWK